ncbi:DUF6584 family protein [Kitasatospora griseola]|uniref:DUF6584 family protein n=1 Tax=Kitasatospora griseola TaxID=2064 RepID=UPI0037FB4540
MSIESTLAEIDSDLREGRHGLARRRLRGLVSSFPTDLTIRRRFADAHRAAGSAPDEAGRWGYLSEDLRSHEFRKFGRRFPDPARRLALLLWPDPAHNPPSTRTARRRLAILYRHATGADPDWPDHREDAAAAPVLSAYEFEPLDLRAGITPVRAEYWV